MTSFSLIQEHGIPTDGSEQPDMTQSELSSRVNDTLHLDSIELDQSGNLSEIYIKPDWSCLLICIRIECLPWSRNISKELVKSYVKSCVKISVFKLRKEGIIG